jgi:hypothetical protein
MPPHNFRAVPPLADPHRPHRIGLLRLWQRFVTQTTVQIRNPLPRAPLPLIFPPNHVSQRAPNLLAWLIQAVPSWVALLGRREYSPLSTLVISPVEPLPILAIFLPLVTFHAVRLPRPRLRNKGESSLKIRSESTRHTKSPTLAHGNHRRTRIPQNPSRENLRAFSRWR